MGYRPREHLAQLRRVGRHRRQADPAWRASVDELWRSVLGRWVAGPGAIAAMRTVDQLSRTLARHAYEVVVNRWWPVVARACRGWILGATRGVAWRSIVDDLRHASWQAARSGAIILAAAMRVFARRVAALAVLAWAAVRRVPWRTGLEVGRTYGKRAAASTWTMVTGLRPKVDQAGSAAEPANPSPVREREPNTLPAWLTQVRDIPPVPPGSDRTTAPLRAKHLRSAARERRVRAVMLSLITLLGTAGAGMLLAAFTMEPPRPPQPARAAQDSAMLPQQQDSSGAQDQPSLPRSEPTTIEIPSIGVYAKLLSLGVDADNQLAVPPLDKADMASWYNLGPSPGELGSAVIVGHVDSEKTGPAVFFNLGRLQAGDLIKVARKDGTVVEFKVDAVMSFPKSEFPSNYIYGGEDRATLRVITCGGEFDKKNKNYLSNTVVFASYTP